MRSRNNRNHRPHARAVKQQKRRSERKCHAFILSVYQSRRQKYFCWPKFLSCDTREKSAFGRKKTEKKAENLRQQKSCANCRLENCNLQGCPPELLDTQTSFRHFTSVCKSTPPLAVVAFEGIQDAMEECRASFRQFRRPQIEEKTPQNLGYQHWDCSQPGTILHEPTLLRYGERRRAAVCKQFAPQKKTTLERWLSDLSNVDSKSKAVAAFS